MGFVAKNKTKQRRHLVYDTFLATFKTYDANSFISDQGMLNTQHLQMH